MKHLLLPTIAAVLLVVCVEAQQSAPTPSDIYLSSTTVYAGSPAGVLVGDFLAVDSIEGEMLEYFSLAPGAGSTDNLFFSLDDTKLTLARPLPQDRERLSIRVRVTDRSGLLIERSFVLTIINTSVRINEIVANNQNGLRDEDGDTPDWIELHNEKAETVDLEGWFLTDDPDNPTKWRLPAIRIGPFGYLTVFASGKGRTPANGELHTTFQLDADGEYLALVRPDGSTVQSEFSPAFPDQFSDVAYGFNRSGTQLGYLFPPSPEKANSVSVMENGANAVHFSHSRGFYDAPFTLTLTPSIPDSIIRYTSDGSTPTRTRGKRYEDPFVVTPETSASQRGTKRIRAAAFSPNAPPGTVDTHTYLFVDGTPERDKDAIIEQPKLRTSITRHTIYRSLIDDALKALPAVSITKNGAISGSEAESSIEFLAPEDGEPGFQINCGIKLVGGHSVGSPKNNYRLYFRGQYGASKLRYDLFNGHPFSPDQVSVFDRLNLRSGSHDNFFWLANTGNPPVGNRHGDAQLIRNRWINDMQFTMGQESIRGRFVHLFVNGSYHGQYQILEWPNDHYHAANLGGEKTDYEYTNGANANKSGSDQWKTTWRRLKSLATSNYDEARRWIDMENLADYMILNFYAGNTWDWNPNQNWMAGGPNQPDRGGWKFYCWDADIILQDVNNDATGKNVPDGLFRALMDNHEPFRVLFRDRVSRHLFNNGALTPDRALEIYRHWHDHLHTSIVAETARWQPNNPASAPWDRDGEWSAEFQHFQRIWFPRRTKIVIRQLRDRGWYPVDGPVFSHPGGPVRQPLSVTLAHPDGQSQILYTLDGSDPYAPTSSQRDETLLIDQGHAAKALVPSLQNEGNHLGDRWKGDAEPFPDSQWRNGVSGIGYETSGDNYRSMIGLDVEAMRGTVTSIFIRMTFDAPKAATIDDWDEFRMRMKYDDGFVAWLNGTEIARANAPVGTPAWNSAATAGHSDSDAEQFVDFDIPDQRFLLKPGDRNLLAVQALNVNLTSSDLLILPQLFGVKTLSSEARPTNVRLYGEPITVDRSMTVRARVLNPAGEWGPIQSAEFVWVNTDPVPADMSNITVSEIHYNPHELDEFEFIEFLNLTEKPLDLGKTTLREGIEFDFPANTILPAQERIAVVRNLDSFSRRYGNASSPYFQGSIQVAGEWKGSLSNNGERILVQGVEDPIQTIKYDDQGRWPGRSDGLGSSVELKDALAIPRDDLDAKNAFLADGSNWRPSSEFHGSPGKPGLGPDHRVVFNEILSHSITPQADRIELVNTTNNSVDLSGWLLSSDNQDYSQFRIPPLTELAPKTRISLGLRDVDNLNPHSPSKLVSRAIGRFYLLQADAAGRMIRFVDEVEFGGLLGGEPIGRWPDTSGPFYPLVKATFGRPNEADGNTVRVGPVAISEIHYNPPGPDVGLEFIRVTNTSPEDLPLDHWRLRGEAEFEFPIGSQVASGESILIVGFSRADTQLVDRFFQFYDFPAGVYRLFGPWNKNTKLDNGGGAVELLRPDDLFVASDGTSFYPLIIEDTVPYDDEKGWPIEPDGDGASLARINTNIHGAASSNWRANPTPLRTGIDYDTWAAVNFPDNISISERMATRDPDGDGLTNYGEFVFALNPTAPDTHASLAITQEANGTIVVRYRRRSDHSFDYSIEQSVDLRNWTVIEGFDGAIQPLPGEAVEIATGRFANVGANEIFFRINARAR